MRGGGSAGDAVEVVLEDGTGDRSSTETSAVARRARGGRRRSVLVGLLAVVALAAASVIMTAQEERRERDRRDELADVAGVLPRLDGPLVELWSVTEGEPFAVGQDVVLLATASTGRLRAVDLRTGVQTWARPVAEDETCVALGDDASPARPMPGDTVADYVACYRRFATVEGYRVVVGEPATVELLDVTTGAFMADVPTPADVLGVEQTGSDLLVASLDADGAVLVSRWALDGTAAGSADQVWSTRLPERLEVIDESGWVFHAEADVVRVGVVGSVPLDLATGEPRPDAAREGVLFTDAVPLPGGGRVEWDYDEVARTTGVSRVVAADGGAPLELAGVPWRPGVADGSAPDVLLLRRPTSLTDTGQFSGDLVAVDATTGEDLWAGGRMAGMEALVRLDGLVVTVGAGVVMALDVRTGEVVWEDRRSGASAQLGGLTDGEVVLVAQTAGAEPAVVARDVRTGAERWRVALADLLRGHGPLNIVPTRAGLLVLNWEGGAAMLGAR